MKQPHKHAALIKAWADGAEIQFFDKDVFEWRTSPSPSWVEDRVYRIKPEPKPDVVQMWYAESNNFPTQRAIGEYNLKLTFDGETGKLKSAEVL